MLLQSIVIADRHFDQARRSVDFIQKYIFPGGALPSCGALLASVSRVTDLQITNLQDIGLDYARTLQIWRERFPQRLQEVRFLLRSRPSVNLTQRALAPIPRLTGPA